MSSGDLALDDSTRAALKKVSDAVTTTVVSSCSARKARQIVVGEASSSTAQAQQAGRRSSSGAFEDEDEDEDDEEDDDDNRGAGRGAGAINTWFAASSGFEIEGSNAGTDVEYRVGDVYRPVLADARAALRDMLAGIPGAVVHDQVSLWKEILEGRKKEGRKEGRKGGGRKEEKRERST